MHRTAALTGRAFFDIYGTSGSSVLEIGSANVNGSLRDGARGVKSYLGVDLAPGLDVDQVLDDCHVLPFGDCAYDLVVSSSAIEHDPMFWITFGEMVRVSGKFIYISAPVQGPVHNHPMDCYRFYPDAGMGLAMWGKHLGYDVRLVESFLYPPEGPGDIWWDFVAVFAKNGVDCPTGSLVKKFASVVQEPRATRLTTLPVTESQDGDAN